VNERANARPHETQTHAHNDARGRRYVCAYNNNLPESVERAFDECIGTYYIILYTACARAPVCVFVCV